MIQMFDETKYKEVNPALDSYLPKEITDLMPDRHFCIDEQGIIHSTFGNIESELFYGIGDFEQLSVFDFATHDISQQIKQAIAACLIENKMVNVEYSFTLSQLKQYFPDATGPSEEQCFEIKIHPTNFVIEEKRLLVCSNRNITERKQMELKLHEMATTDPLTGLYNRRYVMQELESCLQRCKRYNLDVSVIMIDIDYFKKVNDTYGHDIGDLVLIELSHFLKNEVREVDITSRLGGEEFLILILNTQPAQASQIAQRIIKSISEIEITIPGANLSVTVSGGLSQMRKNDDTKEAVLKRADTALYHSKENGRNQLTKN
jgi:diguanylate cyclase (GGDEF)-like protein